MFGLFIRRNNNNNNNNNNGTQNYLLQLCCEFYNCELSSIFNGYEIDYMEQFMCRSYLSVLLICQGQRRQGVIQQE
jgi:hypothetical protein